MDYYWLKEMLIKIQPFHYCTLLRSPSTAGFCTFSILWHGVGETDECESEILFGLSGEFKQSLEKYKDSLTPEIISTTADETPS